MKPDDGQRGDAAQETCPHELVERKKWQAADIEVALVEADAGDFAAGEDVAALARKWR